MTIETPPMTPPDCDLRGLPFMPLDVIRMLDSDLFALATGAEFKAAIALWCKSWLQLPASSLPDDDRVLAHLSGAGPSWKKVKAMALRGFVKCSDGRLYHPVVAEKALDAWDRRSGWVEKQVNRNERQERWRGKLKTLSDQLRGLGVTPPRNATLATLERLLVDTQASTQASHVDDAETAKDRDRDRDNIPLSSDNGAEAKKSEPSHPLPDDPDKQFWDAAKAFLGSRRASMIGKWVRDYGRDVTAKAITEAQIQRAVDPIPYIERCLRGAGREAEFSSPC